jgi:hypothetical protein
MTVNEYEERFRPPAPSLHQTFAATKGPNQKPHRRRILLAAAAVALLTITCSAKSHHALRNWTSSHDRTTAAQEQRSLAV